MPSIYDVYPNELIEKTAEKLKEIKEIKPPEWAVFVKTGVYKERPPVDIDWWYMRAAAILRSIYRLGPIGVNKLRTKYGGKQRRGHKPSRFKKGSGNIIRKCLQQLEKAGLVKNIEKGIHKGRVMTPKGISFLDKLAGEIVKTKPKPKIEKIEIPKKVKKEAAQKEGEKIEQVRAEKKTQVEEKPKKEKAEKKEIKKVKEEIEAKPAKQEAKPAPVKEEEKQIPVNNVEEKKKVPAEKAEEKK